MTDFEVVVVGGGPSGLMTASELASAGMRTLLLEKRGEPALSRAGVIQPRVMEIFAMRGLADAVLARARELNGEKYRTSGGIWAGLPGIDYELLDSDYPYITVLSQLELERVLAARCEALGVTIRRGCEVVGVEQDDERVSVRFRDDDRENAVTALFAVGADGARSTVRNVIGVDWIGHDARNLAVNVDADLAYPFDEPIHVENSPRGWGLSYPLSETVTRFGMIDGSTMLGVGRGKVVTLDEGYASLRRVFGSDFGQPPARISQFHDAMFRASRLRVGRVLLVGESVRVHYPASGVGMNFALQDAFNLGWKIAATVQGWGDAGLLDTYETERGADVDVHLDMVRSQTGLQFDYSDEAIALKNLLMNELLPLAPVQRRLAELLSGLGTHYGVSGELVGSPVRNQPAEHGDVFSAIRPDGYLLVLRSDAGVAERERVSVVTAELPVGVDALVVRPDGYIAAAGTLDEMDAWLGAAVGAAA